MSQKGVKENTSKQSMLLDGLERMLVGLGKFCDRMEKLDARIEALESGQKRQMRRHYHLSPIRQDERSGYVRFDNRERDIVDQKVGSIKSINPPIQPVYEEQLQIQIEEKKSCFEELISLKEGKDELTKKEENLSVYAQQSELNRSFSLNTHVIDLSLPRVVSPYLQDEFDVPLKMGNPIIIFDPGDWVCIKSPNQMKYKLQAWRDGKSNGNSNKLNLLDSRTNPFEERGNDTSMEGIELLEFYNTTRLILKFGISVNLRSIFGWDPGISGFSCLLMD